MRIKVENIAFVLVVFIFGMVVGFSFVKPEVKPVREIDLVKTIEDCQLTVYHSTTWECDSSPFITASGLKTTYGIIAMNTLPLGTKVRIKELGNQVFLVADRLNSRYKTNIVDLWLPERVTVEVIR